MGEQIKTPEAVTIEGREFKLASEVFRLRDGKVVAYYQGESAKAMLQLGMIEGHSTWRLMTPAESEAAVAEINGTPKPQIQVGEMKAWRISDGDHHLVAARTEDEAREVYRREINDAVSADDVPDPKPVTDDIVVGDGEEADHVSSFLAASDGPGVIASTLL